MNKKSKIIVCILITIIGILVIIRIWHVYSWYHPNLYVEDFELVSDDYEKIVEILYEYYDKENFTDDIYIDIDNKDCVISYNNNTINISEDEKQSLKEICETSYPGHYDFIWVSKNDIIFWQDETKTYGVMYTKNFYESENSIKEWNSGVEFKRINSKWYELGHFGI